MGFQLNLSTKEMTDYDDAKAQSETAHDLVAMTEDEIADARTNLVACQRHLEILESEWQRRVREMEQADRKMGEAFRAAGFSHITADGPVKA